MSINNWVGNLESTLQIKNMSDQNAAVAKKATKVRTPTERELKRLRGRIRHRNKVTGISKGGINNTSGDITTKTSLFSPRSMSNNSGKTVTLTEVPRAQNFLTVQSGEGQSYKRNSDDVDYKSTSGSSALILTAAEGSLSHPTDDESKRLYADSLDVDSLDVNISNNQFLKDSLPVIEHAGSSGKGLPYAPENWPSPGDVWTWRVGKRCTRTGFWQDRSVQPPDHLRSSTGNKMAFYSRLALEQYIRNTFPHADVDAVFASFIWRIPCTNAAKDASLEISKSNECSKSALAIRPGGCKASNEMCCVKAQTSSSFTPATCYICCSEPNFCPYCCCILCSETVDWMYGGYNFIKCEALVEEKFICGHVAHIECGLRAHMAGKVEGSIILDAQYYCRCCDNKTDLLLHVDKIIKICESIDKRDDTGKILNLGLSILHGSEKEKAKKLRNHIAILMEKLKQGVSHDETWKKKSKVSEPKQGMSDVGRNALRNVLFSKGGDCNIQAEEEKRQELEVERKKDHDICRYNTRFRRNQLKGPSSYASDISPQKRSRDHDDKKDFDKRRRDRSPSPRPLLECEGVQQHRERSSLPLDIGKSSFPHQQTQTTTPSIQALDGSSYAEDTSIVRVPGPSWTSGIHMVNQAFSTVDRLGKEIEELTRLQTKALEKEKYYQHKLNNAQAQISGHVDEINSYKNEVDIYKKEIDAYKKEIESLKVNKNKLEEESKKRETVLEFKCSQLAVIEKEVECLTKVEEEVMMLKKEKSRLSTEIDFLRAENKGLLESKTKLTKNLTEAHAKLAEDNRLINDMFYKFYTEGNWSWLGEDLPKVIRMCREMNGDSSDSPFNSETTIAPPELDLVSASPDFLISTTSPLMTVDTSGVITSCLSTPGPNSKMIAATTELGEGAIPEGGGTIPKKGGEKFISTKKVHTRSKRKNSKK